MHHTHTVTSSFMLSFISQNIRETLNSKIKTFLFSGEKERNCVEA